MLDNKEAQNWNLVCLNGARTHGWEQFLNLKKKIVSPISSLASCFIAKFLMNNGVFFLVEIDGVQII